MIEKGVLILSAPRSGSSFLAYLFHVHGVDFGQGTQMAWRAPGSHRGVPGYGECPVLSELLRGQIQASGDLSRGLPPEPILDILSPTREQIREVLLLNKSGPIIGFKNGNLSYTFPFWWENVFSRWPFPVEVVALFRDPSYMATSSARMRGTPFAFHFALWKRTYSDLLLWEKLYKKPFHWVEYPSGIGEERVFEQLGIPYDKEKRAQIWHEATSTAEPTPSGYEYLNRFCAYLIVRAMQGE